MPDAPRQDWSIGTVDAHIKIMRRAAPADLAALARGYDWHAHPAPVLGWVMAQSSVDLASAVAIFFRGGPERFNYLPKKSVPRGHAATVRLLDNICLRIKRGFYLPLPGACPPDAAPRLAKWVAAQRADRAEGARGRWVLDEDMLNHVMARTAREPPAPQPEAPPGPRWRARLRGLIAPAGQGRQKAVTNGPLMR